MVKKIFNILEFAKYLNIVNVKNPDLHIVNYTDQKNLTLKSAPVTIDFYLLAIKPPVVKLKEPPFPYKDLSNSYMYLDCPQNTLEWDVEELSTGYGIMVSAKLLNRYAKEYNFMHYNNHEALYLKKEEAVVLWDLYTKAFEEFQKDNYAKEVILSYTALILSYTQQFYNRQFDSRSKIYNRVITDFNKNLEDYFKDKDVSGLPSVAYFAQKANLSANYFGDLIKHFTGESPIEHIHEYILGIAKQKLQQTNLSVSEISYSLGFDYPTYFTRFFRNKTGVAPKIFRNL